MMSGTPSTQISIDAVPVNIDIYQPVDNDFVLVDINLLAERTEQINKDQLIGQKISEAFPEAKEFGLIEVLQRVHHSQKPACFEYNHFEDNRISEWRINEIVPLDNGLIMAVYRDNTAEVTKEQKFNTLGRLLDNSASELYIFDPETLRFCYLNKGAEQNTGYSFEEIKVMTPLDLKPEIDYDQLFQIIEPILTHKQDIVSLKTFHQRKDHTTYEVEAHLQIMKMEGSDKVVATVIDTTHKNKLENELLMLGKIIDNSMNEVYMFDADTLRFSYLNKSAEDNIGYTLNQLQCMTPIDIKPEFNFQSFTEKLNPLFVNDTQMVVFDSYHKRQDGSLYDAEARVQLMNIAGKKVFVAIVMDITQRKLIERDLLNQKARLEHMATHDALTGIYNRALFYNQFEKAIKDSNRTNYKVGILFIDLDNFKDINDTYGHIAGDLTLKEFVERIQKLIRETDTFARHGGDEFVILLEHIQSEENMNMVAHKICQLASEPYLFDKYPFDVTVSIGGALFPDEGKTVDQLIQIADQNLYQSKSSGKNSYYVGGKESRQAPSLPQN